jgi:predicted nucleic acid-binding protein
MIVVDTNIVVYLYLPTEFTGEAEQLLNHDPVWAAPVLWRSEFRNVLALYLRKELVNLTKALQLQTEAESLLLENEYEVPSLDVFQLVQISTCSAYDCEFVALAQKLGTKLITMDKAILNSFPDTAISLKAFVS